MQTSTIIQIHLSMVQSTVNVNSYNTLITFAAEAETVELFYICQTAVDIKHISLHAYIQYILGLRFVQ